jgi:hypothetical protein
MTGRRVVLLSSALLLAPGALPATAGEYWQLHRHHDRVWHTVHRSIYELENRITLLEANPEVGDAYKGQPISGARADIRGLNTKLDPPMAVGCAVLLLPQTCSPSLSYTCERFSPRMARRIAAAAAYYPLSQTH